LRVTYSGLYDTEITVGIDNLFDTDPPFMRYDNSGHDPAFSDPIGRFLWMAVKKSF
jgi:iron complex outermembrane receptor protein